MSRNIFILSGGFDPIHDGHIAMFKEARVRSDFVVVGLNSDKWLSNKKGKPFMSYASRKSVLESIKYIDDVISFDDSDGTALSLLKYCKEAYTNCSLTFGNGGDRSNNNYPEYQFCINNNIELLDTLGGTNKMNSSSILLDTWKIDSTIRDWGLWKVLQQYSPNTTKIKELVVNPKQSLSWQMHHKRSELWFIRKGTATLYLSQYSNRNIDKRYFTTGDSVTIPLDTWHRLSNETEEILSIIEIQYGCDCIESDITRLPFPGVS